MSRIRSNPTTENALATSSVSSHRRIAHHTTLGFLDPETTIEIEVVSQSREISLVERFTLSEDKSRLDYRVTITDPVTFTQSFDLTRYWVWRPEIPLASWRCGESQALATAVP